MQKTLEILKNEDGLIIKRLSDKKLLFVYKVPILLGLNSDVVVGYLPVKIRYRINDELSNHYRCCDISKLYRGISQKWGIKMKNIIANYSISDIDIQGKRYSFDRLISSLSFNDPAWIREHQLKQLLQ